MRVAGGLNFVTGPMGSGKSLFAVRRLVHAVTSGQYVVTNVELTNGWADRVAKHTMPWGSKRKRDHLASRLEHLYVFEKDLVTARRYRPPGSGEARAVFIWDEGHNDLNNRRWKDDGRGEILEWATQLRKLGFVGYLLTQHGDNTDAALRRIANHHVKLQNQREQTRLLGMRVSPWPLFLAYWYPAHLALVGSRPQAVRVDRYFLTWHRHLYDTFGLFHGLDADDEGFANVVWLPELPPRGTVLPRSGRGAAHRQLGPATLDLSLETVNGGALPGVPRSAHREIPARSDD